MRQASETQIQLDLRDYHLMIRVYMGGGGAGGGVVVLREGDTWWVGVGKCAPHGFRCL